MKEFKGTPGPWRVSEKRGDLIDIRHNNNEPGAMSLNLAHVVARLSWLREAEANARIIAAAPELLEELIKLRNYLDDVAQSIDAQRFIDSADVIITKALGETK